MKLSRNQGGWAGAGRLSFRKAVVGSIGLLAVATLSLTAIGSDSAHAQAINFEPQSIVSVDNSAAGANSDVTGTFCVDYTAGCALPQPTEELDSSNFGATVAFTPPEFTVPAGEGGGVDIGAFVIQLSSAATLGVVNGPCQPSGLTPSFNMINATTNVGGPQVQFGDDDDAGTLGEIFEDDDGDTLPNGVQMYPDFLDRIFNGAEPHARYYGQTNVVGADVSLNFVVFEPGATIATPQGAFQTDPNMGYPSVTILQNVGDPEGELAEANPITDFCSPLKATTTTFGETEDNPVAGGGGGATFRTNPAAEGTYNFVQFAASQRDADGDGFENGLDTCPFDTNQENPRVGGDPGDPDDDGIDSACDPDPAAICYPPDIGAAASDCDGDGIPNRGDNCPLEANGKDEDSQADGDFDGIGDVCDDGGNGPNSADGEVTALCIVNSIEIPEGAGGDAPGSDDYLCTTSGACIDADNNGVCDFQEGGGAAAGDDDDTDDTTTTDDDTTTTADDTTTTTDGDGIGDGGPGGGAATGIGSLAPAASSIPVWATIISGLGGAGLLGSLGTLASRILRRRD